MGCDLSLSVRQGSMDAAIRNEEVRDFDEFYRDNPSIMLVVFDSLLAEKVYRRRVLPTLTKELNYLRVLSPSPVYAKMNYPAKLTLWQKALRQDL